MTLPWHLAPAGPNVASAFVAAAARWPDKTALVCGAQRLSYRELSRRVAGQVQALADAGVQPGERVLVYLDNSVELAVAVHAVLALGAVLVPVSPLTRGPKLAWLLAHSGAVALVTQASLAPQWQQADLSALRGVWSGAVPAAAPLAEPAAVAEQALAALIYTSGTTGEPKGVMLSHRNMRAAWAMVQAYLGLAEADVVGLALPATFSYGLYHVLMSLGLGATLVLERSAAFPAKLLHTWAAERVSLFPGVPTLFAALLGQRLEQHPLPALRLLTNAAAALPVAHVQRLQAAWPQAQLLAMYGMTECKRASYLPADQALRRPGSVGCGLAGQRHWLVDAQGQALPHGSTGELVLAGPHVMQGYWRNPEATAARLRPGPDGDTALFTGDLFRSDEAGYLHFVARSDDIIKTRGEKVSPVEVEHAICRLPGVEDAAVVGQPDPQLGEAVWAYVKLAPAAQLNEHDVIRHCLAQLESYMAPQRVHFVDSLPQTDSGKVRRAGLRPT